MEEERVCRGIISAMLLILWTLNLQSILLVLFSTERTTSRVPSPTRTWFNSKSVSRKIPILTWTVMMISIKCEIISLLLFGRRCLDQSCMIQSLLGLIKVFAWPLDSGSVKYLGVAKPTLRRNMALSQKMRPISLIKSTTTKWLNMVILSETLGLANLYPEVQFTITEALFRSMFLILYMTRRPSLAFAVDRRGKLNICKMKVWWKPSLKRKCHAQSHFTHNRYSMDVSENQWAIPYQGDKLDSKPAWNITPLCLWKHLSTTMSWSTSNRKNVPKPS